MTAEQDPRLTTILELLTQLESQELDARAPASAAGDELDAIIAGVNRIAEHLRAANEKVKRNEKLAKMGQLCGGVAHELRNPLGALKNAAYFLKIALPVPEPEIKETLSIIDKEVQNCERIIRNLLSFARPGTSTFLQVGINALVEESLSGAVIPDNVSITRELGASLPAVLVDPVQLGQAFGNIVQNAMQAMADRGGRLTVRTEMTSSGKVAISFEDTGPGIRPEDLANVFEPLFTTKAKGIGLGLAVTRTLIEGQRGTISVQSEASRGATFRIELPTETAQGEADDR